MLKIFLWWKLTCRNDGCIKCGGGIDPGYDACGWAGCGAGNDTAECEGVALPPMLPVLLPGLIKLIAECGDEGGCLKGGVCEMTWGVGVLLVFGVKHFSLPPDWAGLALLAAGPPNSNCSFFIPSRVGPEGGRSEELRSGVRGAWGGGK